MSDTERALPKTIWEGAFPIFGMTVRCYVLEDGRRILHADDVGALLARMGEGRPTPEGEDYEAFARWIKGGSAPMG